MTPEHSRPSISIFGGEYNAKTKSPEEIATDFVKPDRVFRKLAAANNTLLVGPRGSGKTTLMRMLEGPAIERYDESDAQFVREAVGYTAVMVTGDQSWASQLKSLAISGEHGQTFATCVFTLHCLRSLVKAADERSKPAPSGVSGHRRVMLDEATSRSIARSVGKAWGISQPVADLGDLAVAITDEISDVWVLRSSSEGLPSEELDRLVRDTQILHRELISSSIQFIERFNRAVNSPHDRWAFLFDEAELMPRFLIESTLRLLRGTDNRLIFKISYAPYENGDFDFSKPLGPQEANDFTALSLTYANKREAFPFTEKLFRHRLASSGHVQDPKEVLGATTFVALDEEGDDEGVKHNEQMLKYAPEGHLTKVLKDLAAIDPTFVAWLDTNEIDLERLPDLPEERRARVRKVLPNVAIRAEYLKASRDSDAVLRGRKSVPLYSGWEAFYSMMEGNPRWLMHVCDDLLEGYSGEKISRESQAIKLRSAADEFQGYLRILPIGDGPSRIDDGPKRLLHRINTYFKNQYVRKDFSSDPAGSFRVDQNLSPSLTLSLCALANRGAIIEVGRSEGSGLHGLAGKRFRPAYILAPLYGLPLRLEKDIALSKILVSSPSGQLRLGEEA